MDVLPEGAGVGEVLDPAPTGGGGQCHHHWHQFGASSAVEQNKGDTWTADSQFGAGGAADYDPEGFNSWQGVAPLPQTATTPPTLHARATRSGGGAMSALDMFYDEIDSGMGAATTGTHHGHSHSSGAPHRQQHNLNLGNVQHQLHPHQLVGEHFHHHQQQPNSCPPPTFGGAHAFGTADVAPPPLLAVGQWQGGTATSGLHFDGGAHWSGAGPEAPGPHSFRPHPPSPGRAAGTGGPGAATPNRLASPHTAGSPASALSAPPRAHPAATVDAARAHTPPQAGSWRPKLEQRVRRGAVPSTPESAPGSPSGGGADSGTDRNVRLEDLSEESLATIDRKALSRLMEASKLTDVQKSAIKKNRRLYKNRISAQGALSKKKRAVQMLEAVNGQLVLKAEDLQRQNETLRQRIRQLEWHFARAQHAPEGFART